MAWLFGRGKSKDLVRTFEHTDMPGDLVRTFEGHTNWVLSCCFSPGDGGQLVLSASADKTLKLRNTATGDLVRTFEGHTNWVYSCCFSPGDGGQLVLSASADKTLKLWNAATGDLVRTFEGHTNWVLSCCFSPGDGGQLVLSASWDKTLKLWNTATGDLVRTFGGHTKAVYSCCFSPGDGGQLVLSASADKTLKLWNAATGDLVRTFEGHTDMVLSCCFSPGDGGQLVLSASADKTLKLWNTATGDLVRTFEGHTNAVSSCCFSPGDGQLVLSASADMTLKLWRLPDELTRLRWSTLGHRHRDDIAAIPGLQEALNELDALVGLEDLKDQMAAEVSLFLGDGSRSFLNLVITGPSGVGKTTVAKRIARIFSLIGAVRHSDVWAIGKNDITGPYVNQVDGFCREKFLSKAQGRVTLFDEAHQFAAAAGGSGDQDKDAATASSALCKILDEFQQGPERVCMILAGYSAKMERVFDIDEGFDRRFPRALRFELSGMSPAQLARVFKQQAALVRNRADNDFDPIIVDVSDERLELFFKTFQGQFPKNGGDTLNFLLCCRIARIQSTLSSKNLVQEPDLVGGLEGHIKVDRGRSRRDSWQRLVDASRDKFGEPTPRTVQARYCPDSGSESKTTGESSLPSSISSLGVNGASSDHCAGAAGAASGQGSPKAGRSEHASCAEAVAESKMEAAAQQQLEEAVAEALREADEALQKAAAEAAARQEEVEALREANEAHQQALAQAQRELEDEQEAHAATQKLLAEEIRAHEATKWKWRVLLGVVVLAFVLFVALPAVFAAVGIVAVIGWKALAIAALVVIVLVAIGILFCYLFYPAFLWHTLKLVCKILRTLGVSGVVGIIMMLWLWVQYMEARRTCQDPMAFACQSVVVLGIYLVLRQYEAKLTACLRCARCACCHGDKVHEKND
eukprot:g1876.t1